MPVDTSGIERRYLSEEVLQRYQQDGVIVQQE
jgi:hypothetical protein